MKKIIYSSLIILASALAISGCTEEEVKPSAETSNGGGGGSTGPLKP